MVEIARAVRRRASAWVCPELQRLRAAEWLLWDALELAEAQRPGSASWWEEACADAWASRYLAAMDAGRDGGAHDALRRAALALVRGFALREDVALGLLALEYAPRCRPSPPRRELERQIRGAAHSTRCGLGYLLRR